jgi:hypothetical protein
MKKDFLIVGLIAVAALYFLKSGSGSSTESKRQSLLSWGVSGSDYERWRTIVLQMSPAEIASTYTFVFDYVQKDIRVPQPSDLFNQISAISIKYQIFT